mgnify:CR=1 FL=1
MKYKYSLFEVFGVEMEYMIVDRATLNVKPLADRLIESVEGAVVSETEQGALAWCNELVKHVIELKTNGPASGFAELPALFQNDVRRINSLLERFDACLLPTAMHPWMDPYKETQLWDHEYSIIYETFNKIFDCRGHGWANLQSTHLNLPFGDDEEFGRLHASIRAVLPLLPVLAASSPVMDKKVTGTLDNRLSVYRSNAKKIPSVSGKVIPEPCYTEADYRNILLQKIYDDIAPFDPDGILQDEWLNARGAIARFDRGAIEIRVLDLQEFPGADIAILEFVVVVIRALCQNRWIEIQKVMLLDTDMLSNMLTLTTKLGGETEIDYPEFTACFGVDGPIKAEALWQKLYNELADEIWDKNSKGREHIRLILSEGNLSQRITRALGPDPDSKKLLKTYDKLRICLHEGYAFHSSQ